MATPGAESAVYDCVVYKEPCLLYYFVVLFINSALQGCKCVCVYIYVLVSVCISTWWSLCLYVCRRLTIIILPCLPLFILLIEPSMPSGAEFIALSPRKLRESAEDKREFHFAVSREISLLQDFLAPVLLWLRRPVVKLSVCLIAVWKTCLSVCVCISTSWCLCVCRLLVNLYSACIAAVQCVVDVYSHTLDTTQVVIYFASAAVAVDLSHMNK